MIVLLPANTRKVEILNLSIQTTQQNSSILFSEKRFHMYKYTYTVSISRKSKEHKTS